MDPVCGQADTVLPVVLVVVKGVDGDGGRRKGGRGAIIFFPFFSHEVLNAETQYNEDVWAGVLLLVNTLGRGCRGITCLDNSLSNRPPWVVPPCSPSVVGDDSHLNRGLQKCHPLRPHLSQARQALRNQHERKLTEDVFALEGNFTTAGRNFCLYISLTVTLLISPPRSRVLYIW